MDASLQANLQEGHQKAAVKKENVSQFCTKTKDAVDSPISIVMYSGLYRADKSKAKYKPESSTQKGRVNPPPPERGGLRNQR